MWESNIGKLNESIRTFPIMQMMLRVNIPTPCVGTILIAPPNWRIACWINPQVMRVTNIILEC